MDEKEPLEGVYITKYGKFKVVFKSQDPKWYWEIDEGKIINHPFLRIKQSVTKASSNGNYFINKEIKNCEYLGIL